MKGRDTTSRHFSFSSKSFHSFLFFSVSARLSCGRDDSVQTFAGITAGNVFLVRVSSVRRMCFNVETGSGNLL